MKKEERMPFSCPCGDSVREALEERRVAGYSFRPEADFFILFAGEDSDRDAHGGYFTAFPCALVERVKCVNSGAIPAVPVY